MPVGTDAAARGQLHGLHEHRHLFAATRSQRQRADDARRDAAAPGVARQPDGHRAHHPAQRRRGRRQSSSTLQYLAMISNSSQFSLTLTWLG